MFLIQQNKNKIGFCKAIKVNNYKRLQIFLKGQPRFLEDLMRQIIWLSIFKASAG
jgi:hypothetical protein